MNPNPLVGAVIVKEGRIIGEGWHERYGQWHAERNALRNCVGDPRGATMYVTLEPCCHHGKTPPCTEALVKSGLARVVVGMKDPNPLVAGKGIARLREAGIEVECGLEEETLREQNRVFLKYIQTRRPWVVMKTAMTLDGKIATRAGDSRWVTGEAARTEGHELRSRLMAISENYPDLKANQNFLDLQTQLEGTENRISVERRKYNEAARDFNVYIKMFPRNLVSGLFGFQQSPYFEAQSGAETAPTVQF